MKIDFTTIDRTQFKVDERILNGEMVYLVQPQQMGCAWNQQNKIYRSSPWNCEGESISLSFPKFVNWGENPEVFPLPETLKGATIIEKVDGSLLIVSMWKGNLILRTRGTVDAYELDNGCELDAFKKYAAKLISDWMNRYGETWPHSVLFEWTSPFQKIILNYGDEPKFYLVGVVEHSTYQLWNQIALDWLASTYKLLRPPTYTFTTIENLLVSVEAWKGKEGVVVYSTKEMHKVKGAWYLALHHMKSELASFEKVIDVWFRLGRPTYQDFYAKVAELFDFELANQVQGDMSRICDGWKTVEKILLGFQVFIRDVLAPLPDRKSQALKTISSYGQTNRASFVFKMLDGKALQDDDLKKLLYQALKK
jgi:hypothetical protein